MLPFRAPSSGLGGGGARDASGRKPVSTSGGGFRIVSQGLARSQQRAADAGTPNALQVDNTSFEEWMKMATDNKINATNTWSFALIDYFHDMSLLRSDSGDGSINFQKASCTLDGCVKVWTSRVDSVMAETGRLLSGLQDEHAAAAGDADADTSRATANADDEDEDAPRTKRRNRAREATLAKSFAQLQAKQFDLEFSVDPLFKKTSADFDEGGAGGLLMNHLYVDDHMKVVFDASDVTDQGDGEDGLEQEPQGASTDVSKAVPKASMDESAADESHAVEPADEAEASIQTEPVGTPLDLERLRGRLRVIAAQLDNVPVPPETPVSKLLEGRVLCPSTAAFRFSDDNVAELPLPSREDPALDADMDADMDWDDLPDEGGGAEFDYFAAPVDGEEGEREFDVAFAHSEDAAPLAAGNEQERLFEYFDSRMQRNWAGPEHWKLARLHTAPREVPAETPAVEKPKARKKEAQLIDFVSDDGPSVQELFAPSATPAAIKLTKAVQSTTSAHLLPDDQHFNSKKLLRLFLKPKATILLKKREPAPMDDDNAWLNMDDVGSAAFQTDLFQDNDIYEDVLEPVPEPLDGAALGDSDGEDDGFATEVLRRVRPEFVEHAKRAKQVDVKRLKDNLWTSLALSEDSDAPPKPFSRALDALEGLYPRQKYDEISTSFCFICLLHLANEEGLELRVPEAQGAPGDDEAHVGQLGALQVRHEHA